MDLRSAPRATLGEAMPAQTTVIFRRRAALLAIMAVIASAAIAPAPTSARQTLVHAFLARNGTTVVSGYDGGVAVAQPHR